MSTGGEVPGGEACMVHSRVVAQTRWPAARARLGGAEMLKCTNHVGMVTSVKTGKAGGNKPLRLRLGLSLCLGVSAAGKPDDLWLALASAIPELAKLAPLDDGLRAVYTLRDKRMAGNYLVTLHAVPDEGRRQPDAPPLLSQALSLTGRPVVELVHADVLLHIVLEATLRDVPLTASQLDDLHASEVAVTMEPSQPDLVAPTRRKAVA